MATRRPLYYDNGNLREMSESQINQIIAQVSYQYSLNPSVTLTVGSGNVSPNIGAITDTRLIAGATATSATSYPNPPDTTTTTDTINRTAQIDASTSPATLPSGFTRPLYWNGSSIQVMTDDDINDTFIFPAVINLTSALTTAAQGGTYRIHTATSLTDHTLVSSNYVYRDTRANAAAYNTVNETLDQPTTIQNYYLMIINGSEASYTRPLSSKVVDNNFQIFAKSDFDTLLQDYVRYVTTNIVGYRISYSIGATGSGVIRGSGMTDTKLNSQTTNTLFVNANDYRAQDVPAGSAVAQNTYYLRINRS